MAQKVLIIGGSGKWSTKVYHPVILTSNVDDVKLVAIADIINPRESPHSHIFTSQLELHNTEWLALSGNLEEDLIRLDRLMERVEIDTLAIVVPAYLNFHYLNWGISQGLDIICDKPPIALLDQFGTPGAAQELWDKFNYICDRANKSRHRLYQRPCQIYLHLRRRLEEPYIQIYQGLQEVYNLTKQGLTYLQVHLNNGCYRFSGEYNLPGAHGYEHGLGTITHTGYHLIDLAACCLTTAPPIASYIDSQLISCTLVQDVNLITSNHTYGKLLGRSKNLDEIQDSGNGEVDINLAFALKNGFNTHPTCEFQLSLHSRGCTRRTTPYYSGTCTHDEGRVSDTVVILQQGPLQSFHLLLSDDADNDGDLRLVRRLNPKVAELIGQPPRLVYDSVLSDGQNTIFPQKLVKTCLDVFANKLPKGKIETISLEAQKSTMELYVLAIGSAFGKCTSWWENSQLCLPE